ncbi:MAG TPA: response regulator, partial [Candidatus Acidoferrum sp.]|nr:response regulator [Candidatus Acidoferrum sp.]
MRKAQILVVEGENSLSDRLRNRLLDLGYPGPEVVSSGDEALGKIFQIQPDLVLMDFSAGEVEGLKAGEAIRDRYQIPVVYLA